MTQEEWPLSSATAVVSREPDHITATLHGIVTTRCFELLFWRVNAARPRCWVLVVPDATLLAATVRSLADAAAVGTPIEGGAEQLIVRAPCWRSSWAAQLCAQLRAAGVRRPQAAVLETLV